VIYELELFTLQTVFHLNEELYGENKYFLFYPPYNPKICKEYQPLHYYLVFKIKYINPIQLFFLYLPIVLEFTISILFKFNETIH